MKIEKQGLSILLDDTGNPIAVLYRVKEGYWVWKKISDLDEDEQIELYEVTKNKETGRI